MAYYPLFLDLSTAHVLVAGAGAVGRRKIRSLLDAGPGSLTVVDPDIDPGFATKLALRSSPQNPVYCCRRVFAEADIAEKGLVFAATDARQVNAAIAALCRKAGILCNIIDKPEEGNCIVPAQVTQNDLTIAISTGGQSPALAKALRRDLEAFVGKRYTPLLTVLGRLRPLLLELNLPTEDNSAVFRALVDSPLAGYLETNDTAAASALLLTCLPEPLFSRVGDLLHGL